MTEADAVEFARQIHSGFGGQAMWRMACSCGHIDREHVSQGGCRRCSCWVFTRGDHEELHIVLHPDAVNYLPPGVYVIAKGHRYIPLGSDGRGGTSYGVQFMLARDLDSTIDPIVRGGVKEETTVWTSQPEEEA